MKQHNKDTISKKNSVQLDNGKTASQSPLRAYSSPQVLSAEDLEAAAATCDPPTAQGPGKTIPIPCGTLGS